MTKQLERSCYLQLQGRALEKTDWRLLGFALMSNHLHLVALAGRRTLDDWLREDANDIEVVPAKAYGAVASAIVEATATALRVSPVRIRSATRGAVEVLARSVTTPSNDVDALAGGVESSVRALIHGLGQAAK